MKKLDISDIMIILGTGIMIYAVYRIDITVAVLFTGLWVTLYGLYIGNSGRE